MEFFELPVKERADLLLQSVTNNPDGAYNLGDALQAGVYGPEMTAYAHQFYRIAAYGGNARAKFALGMCYAQGEGGVYADMDHAFGWLKQAAEQGVTEANDMLTKFGTEDGRRMLMQMAISGPEGFGSKWYVSKQLVDEYRRLAEEGVADAQYELARQLANPRRVGPFRYDIAEAIKWYTAAAEQGYGDAMYNLGSLYLNGAPGLAPDRSEAKYWLECCADTGDDDAYALLMTHFPEVM